MFSQIFRLPHFCFLFLHFDPLLYKCETPLLHNRTVLSRLIRFPICNTERAEVPKKLQPSSDFRIPRVATTLNRAQRRRQCPRDYPNIPQALPVCPLPSSFGFAVSTVLNSGGICNPTLTIPYSNFWVLLPASIHLLHLLPKAHQATRENRAFTPQYPCSVYSMEVLHSFPPIFCFFIRSYSS